MEFSDLLLNRFIFEVFFEKRKITFFKNLQTKIVSFVAQCQCPLLKCPASRQRQFRCDFDPSDSFSTQTLPLDPSFLFNCSKSISSGLNFINSQSDDLLFIWSAYFRGRPIFLASIKISRFIFESAYFRRSAYFRENTVKLFFYWLILL